MPQFYLNKFFLVHPLLHEYGYIKRRWELGKNRSLALENQIPGPFCTDIFFPKDFQVKLAYIICQYEGGGELVAQYNNNSLLT